MSRLLMRKCVRGMALAAVVVLILDAGRGRLPAQVRATIRAGESPLPGVFGAPSLVSAAFSPDGRLLGTRDITNLTVWDAISGKRLWRRATPPLASIAGPRPPLFSPDGQVVALPTLSGKQIPLELTIDILDARKGTRQRTLDRPLVPLNGLVTRPRGIAFSPDGRLLAAAAFEERTGDFMVRIWDVKTGKAPAAIRLGKHCVYALAVSPDGRSVATLGSTATVTRNAMMLGFGVGGGTDRAVTLWDVASGKRRRALKLDDNADSDAPLLFSPDGKTLFSPGKKGYALWDVQKGQPARTIRNAAEGSDGGVLFEVNLAAFSRDGKSLVFYNEVPLEFWVCDVASGKPRQTGQQDSTYPRAAAMSPHGSLVATLGESGRLSLWDPHTGKRQGELRGLPGDPDKYSAAPGLPPLVFSPDETALAAVSTAGVVTIWDVSKLLPRASGKPGHAGRGGRKRVR